MTQPFLFTVKQWASKPTIWVQLGIVLFAAFFVLPSVHRRAFPPALTVNPSNLSSGDRAEGLASAGGLSSIANITPESPSSQQDTSSEIIPPTQQPSPTTPSNNPPVTPPSPMNVAKSNGLSPLSVELPPRPVLTDARLERLCQQLSSADAIARQSAFRDLANLGVAARPASRAICEAAVSRDDATVRLALETLERVWPEVYPIAVLLSVDRDYNKYPGACQNLARLGPAGADTLPLIYAEINAALSASEKGAMKWLDQELQGLFRARESRLTAAIQALTAIAPNEEATYRILLEMARRNLPNSDGGTNHPLMLASLANAERAKEFVEFLMEKAREGNGKALNIAATLARERPALRPAVAPYFVQLLDNESQRILALNWLPYLGTEAAPALEKLGGLKFNPEEQVRVKAGALQKVISQHQRMTSAGLGEGLPWGMYEHLLNMLENREAFLPPVYQLNVLPTGFNLIPMDRASGLPEVNWKPADEIAFYSKLVKAQIDPVWVSHRLAALPASSASAKLLVQLTQASKAEVVLQNTTKVLQGLGAGAGTVELVETILTNPNTPKSLQDAALTGLTKSMADPTQVKRVAPLLVRHAPVNEITLKAFNGQLPLLFSELKANPTRYPAFVAELIRLRREESLDQIDLMTGLANISQELLLAGKPLTDEQQAMLTNIAKVSLGLATQDTTTAARLAGVNTFIATGNFGITQAQRLTSYCIQEYSRLANKARLVYADDKPEEAKPGPVLIGLTNAALAIKLDVRPKVYPADHWSGKVADQRRPGQIRDRQLSEDERHFDLYLSMLVNPAIQKELRRDAMWKVFGNAPRSVQTFDLFVLNFHLLPQPTRQALFKAMVTDFNPEVLYNDWGTIYTSLEAVKLFGKEAKPLAGKYIDFLQAILDGEVPVENRGRQIERARVLAVLQGLVILAPLEPLKAKPMFEMFQQFGKAAGSRTRAEARFNSVMVFGRENSAGPFSDFAELGRLGLARCKPELADTVDAEKWPIFTGYSDHPNKTRHRLAARLIPFGENLWLLEQIEVTTTGQDNIGFERNFYRAERNETRITATSHNPRDLTFSGVITDDKLSGKWSYGHFWNLERLRTK